MSDGIEFSPHAEALRRIVGRRRGRLRADDMATLRDASIDLDRFAYQVAAYRLIIEHADRMLNAGLVFEADLAAAVAELDATPPPYGEETEWP